ncbi:MAG: 2-oxo acid dehydrogenase subunit E2 [Neisseriaceae bacterium]|nr:2-oxo acid dehydrogenase subunit E2 [Neisseriaceae bacterium]MBP6862321.1 2-oxo acid dehydrogenase subunit E2 [Neisseriaceae bacterium]
MSKLLHMPEVLANTTHATINKWLVQEGDAVVVGQVIAEVETDKALVDMVAEEDAIISKLIARDGDEVAVGAPIAQLNGDGNVDLSAVTTMVALEAEATPAAATASTPAAASPAEAGAAPRLFASPLAKRLAAQHGVDLASLSGSGPRGRIVKRDIEGALQAQAAAPSAVASTPIVAAAVDYDELPLSNMRKTIARRLTESKSTVPHFYLNVDCRVDALMALRQQVNAVAAEKVSVNDLVIKAAAMALKQVPAMNVTWAETAIRQYHHVDISVAVATEKGLLTPVLRQAEGKSLSAIHAEVAELATLARDGKLMPEQYQGGSFSISNLGMFGVSSFNAIINPPQAGILAVGGIKKMPVVVDDALQVASVMSCCLSVDHRVVDGAVAAQWLAVFQQLIEEPLTLLI